MFNVNLLIFSSIFFLTLLNSLFYFLIIYNSYAITLFLISNIQIWIVFHHILSFNLRYPYIFMDFIIYYD
jgi:hypothetical protein